MLYLDVFHILINFLVISVKPKKPEKVPVAITMDESKSHYDNCVECGDFERALVYLWEIMKMQDDQENKYEKH